MTDTPNVAAPKPTIRDVASAAGVSKSLVSLVLQGSANVSESRRRAVLEAMEQLGYRPNRLAQRLSGPRSGTVGVMLNDIRNPWFVELLEGLTASLHAAGVSPVLADSYIASMIATALRACTPSISGVAPLSTALRNAAMLRVCIE